jgi:hypothetical protein
MKRAGFMNNSLKGRGFTGCGKITFRGVILSAAKDLLFACAEDKADPSVTQNRRDFRMTLSYVFFHAVLSQQNFGL